jgi:glycosyltransferase involved in cell wall biosynthesis
MSVATPAAPSARPDRRRPRIGFVYPQPEPLHPDHWSGTPRSLALAIAARGHELLPIAYAPPRPIRHTLTLLSYGRGRRALGRGSASMARVRTHYLRRAVAAAGPLDGLLLLGSDLYDAAQVVPPGLPCATYDDATLVQMMRHPESDPRRNGYPAGEVQHWIERQASASRHASACCVCTGWAAASMIHDYGVSAARVQVVGIGHRPRTPAAGQDRDWSTPRFLFVGADWERKNGAAVVRAFARLREQHPEAVLDLVSKHSPVEHPGIVSHGFLARDDSAAQQLLDRLYANATAFVLPSRFDPAGIAWLEAASAGLPVIATTEGGAEELLGEAAICVHPDDESGLLLAMQSLASPAEARRRGELARRAAAGSTWSAVACRILDAMSLGTAAP